MTADLSLNSETLTMKILLTTLHAKYSHASLALPCLAAYCLDLPHAHITIKELTVNEPPEHLLRLLMAEQADLIAFSCYIWNIELTLRLAADIKKIAPQTRIVLGGPEASFAVFDLMRSNPAVDYVIKGEGEKPFHALLERLLADHATLLPHTLDEVENLFFRDGEEIVATPLSNTFLELDRLQSPFEARMVDLSKPLVYYETSRGCPFSCAFCLSSVEGGVRSFGMERITRDLLFLMSNNVPSIKLVDRTFNYDAARADAIWQFILSHNRTSHFHFEIAADLLTESNIATLKQVPPDTFRFEIGVQSASATVLEKVRRNAQPHNVFSMIKRVLAETTVELHLDLIAGLPGEDYDGFLASLQSIAELHPHDIQIEPLKLLKGSPMQEIGRREGYCFSAAPPYTILHNPWLSYEDICRIETIGRLLDLFNKQGGFPAAFRVLQSHYSFAAILDQMARQAGNDNLSSLSNRRVFELCARLAGALLPAPVTVQFLDALFYDYCGREMPLMGKLPDFAMKHQEHCSWPGSRDFPAHIQPPPHSRVKLFRYTFMADYGAKVHQQTETPSEITFAYISGAGRGLQVIAWSTAC